MLRRIISIDREKCNGCGLCAKACHEGAIGMVDGKAQLLREDYCDGLGDCLPACPAGAISFVERDALAYDEAAVLAAKAQAKPQHTGGCPGLRARQMNRDAAPAAVPAPGQHPSQLTQWPVQIKLVSPQASWFDGADLLIAADCTAYAYGNFHQDFIRGRICLIGCPMLDMTDYSEKLTEIFRHNALRSVTVARMEVPCCGGLEAAVRRALQHCGREIPCRVVTISADGRILP